MRLSFSGVFCLSPTVDRGHLVTSIPPRPSVLASAIPVGYAKLLCAVSAGTIPRQLGRLHALKKLFLYSNKLSGERGADGPGHPPCPIPP